MDKNLGLADPPPYLGQNPKFFEKLDLKAPFSEGLKNLGKSGQTDRLG